MNLGWIALLTLLTGSQALAEQPSYDATVRFLKEKLNTTDFGGEYKYWYSLVELEKCKFQLVQEFKGSSSAPKETSLTTFSATDLNPATIRVTEGGAVWVNTFKSRNSIEVTRVDGSAAYFNDMMISGIASPVTANGKRVGRALTHLVKLCGGKDELF